MALGVARQKLFKVVFDQLALTETWSGVWFVFFIFIIFFLILAENYP